MEMQILSRNMRLSGHSEEYIQKKVARLERHLREQRGGEGWNFQKHGFAGLRRTGSWRR